MVMGPRCSSFRKTESRATLNKEEPSKPPDHEVHDHDTSPVITVKVDSCPTHNTGRVMNDPFANDCNRYRSKSASELQRPRPRSAQMPVKSPTSSLEDILEDPYNVQLYSNQHVISNPSIAASSESSIYRTPPTSRKSDKEMHGIVLDHSSHPLSVKNEANETMRSASLLSFSSIMYSGSQDIHPEREKLHSVVAKMVEAEKSRQRQHDELRDMISDLTKKLVTVALDRQDSKDDPPAESSADVPTPTAEPDLESLETSTLPKNCPVCLTVLLRLSEVVPKWRFLARWLQVQEHEIQRLCENYQNDVQEQWLLKWQQCRSNASYQALGEAVKKAFGDQLYSNYVRMVNEAEGNTVRTCSSQ